MVSNAPRILALAVLLLLAACGDHASSPDPGAVAAARLEIASATAPQPRPLPVAEAQAMLSRIEARIRSSAVAECRERGGRECTWSVAYEPNPTFNAFASGRDRIVVYGGIMALARDEAEVAMVLAHEKAHHILDHVAETNRNAGIGAFVADLLATVGIAWLVEEVGVPLPRPWVDALRRAAVGAGAQAGVLAFSVENEKEADALAAEILHRAGYDLQDARRMILTMGALSRGDRTPGLLRTHPAGPERLAHWDTVAARLQGGARGT